MRRLARQMTSLLRGEDERLSFSKLVLVTLLTGWLFRVPLSAELALVFIVAAHGSKILIKYLGGRNDNGGGDAE